MISKSWKELFDWNKERIKKQRKSISHDNIKHELYIFHKIISDFLYHFNEYNIINNISYSKKLYIISINQS